MYFTIYNSPGSCQEMLRLLSFIQADEYNAQGTATKLSARVTSTYILVHIAVYGMVGIPCLASTRVGLFYFHPARLKEKKEIDHDQNTCSPAFHPILGYPKNT